MTQIDRLLRDLSAAQHGDYSITSSARTSSDGGTSRPIAFAALRLSTNSYWSAPAPASRPASHP